MLTLLRAVGWIACVVYATIPAFWLLIHARAEVWRSSRRSPYRILLPIWIGMWVAVGAITAPWRGVSLYQNRWTLIPAGILFCVGLVLYKLSHGEFSLTQLGGVPEILHNHSHERLVTTGIRARRAPSSLPGPSLRDAGLERGHRPGSLLGADRIRDPDRGCNDQDGGQRVGEPVQRRVPSVSIQSARRFSKDQDMSGSI